VSNYAAGAALVPVIGSLARPAYAQETVMADGYSAMAADERFTTWIRLIDAGGLQSYARAPTPYTVFAVTETGWKKYPQIAAGLLAYQQQSGSHNDANAFPDTSKIVALVRSHTVNGKHRAVEVMGKKLTVTSLAGTPIDVDGTATPVTITWKSQAGAGTIIAPVADTPIIAINAVIYPIDDLGPLMM